MTKKQRNRKLVAQNKRNKMINRRYSSTIKTLLKLFLSKTKMLQNNTIDLNLKQTEKKEIILLVNNLFSFLDKAIKKNVIHKNTAARKKSRISNILKKI